MMEKAILTIGSGYTENNQAEENLGHSSKRTSARKNSSASKIRLKSYDSLFTSTDSFMTDVDKQVQQIPLDQLHTFKNHPFRVLDDEKMQETVDSIKAHGVLVPGIARPHPDGGYEILSGHRRCHASRLAGCETMPMIVKDYSDDEAVQIMVDSNIQREDILPSEKAKAYRMKFDAMKHQGTAGGGWTMEEIGKAAGESGKTVQRYIALSNLIDELLELVDNKKLGIRQGVDISALNVEAQGWVSDIIWQMKAAVSMDQSAKLREYARKDQLSQPMVELILMEKKPVKRKITLTHEKLDQYIPSDYSAEEVETLILDLLNKWKQEGGGEA